jgi:hypothetical protein
MLDCSAPLRTPRVYTDRRDTAAIPAGVLRPPLHQFDRRTPRRKWIILMQMIASADAIGQLE